MKKNIVIGCLLLLLFPLQGQVIIGLSGELLDKEIKREYPSFIRDNTFINNTYKYLKYIDRVSEQTLLVFLSNDNVCTSTKLVCDYSDLEIMKKKLDQYKHIGKDNWVFDYNGTSYIVRLTRDEWFFSVFTCKK